MSSIQVRSSRVGRRHAVSWGFHWCRWFPIGEVVFNTAITGYQILTDPSYYKQLVTLTYPHIGSVGVNAEDAESRQVLPVA